MRQRELDIPHGGADGLCAIAFDPSIFTVGGSLLTRRGSSASILSTVSMTLGAGLLEDRQKHAALAIGSGRPGWRLLPRSRSRRCL